MMPVRMLSIRSLLSIDPLASAIIISEICFTSGDITTAGVLTSTHPTVGEHRTSVWMFKSYAASMIAEHEEGLALGMGMVDCFHSNKD